MEQARLFSRHVGIDYSGAKTPTASLKGLRVYLADAIEPREVMPPPSPRKYWTRKGVAQWLVQLLADATPTLVGIDHGFSLPKTYFDAYGLPHVWPAFLEDFQLHWPTDGDLTRVDDVRQGKIGKGKARMGDTGWRRITEIRAGSAKSCFHFDVQGSVAKSTHSGIPWLRFIRQEMGKRVHFWPFDGWLPAPDRSVIAEVYPRLWNRQFPRDPGMTGDQHDAYCVANWLERADQGGRLTSAFTPSLSDAERETANYEGWILGVA